jgi:hypothetical protein
MRETRANVLEASGLPVCFPLGPMDRGPLPRPHGDDAEAVRVWARSVSVMQKEAVVLSSISGVAWRLASDEGPYLDGFDAAPCPLAFMSTGMVSSIVSELLSTAAARDLRIRDLALVQNNYYTMQGSALAGTMTAGALPVELEAKIACGASDTELRALLDDALRAAPISALIRGRHRSVFSLRRNGEPTSVEHVAGIPPLDGPDPASWLEGLPVASKGAEYRDSAETALVERVTATESIEGVAGGAHTSLSETQQRRLHLRVTCRRRADGMLAIEQQLFSPIGSTFRFLCDPEGTAAPDPAAYVAAGIAFCFMTQLGRYAGILRKSLPAYDVIQDLCLPLAGSGRFDPVATHVYLTTDEDREFARRTVRMGEQTCFLHALCRTDLSIGARIAGTP